MKEIVRLGVIGCGARGEVLINGVLIPLHQEGVQVTAVCDVYADRTQKLADQVEKETGSRPVCTDDYRKIIDMDVDAVIISCAWEYHVEIALAAVALVICLLQFKLGRMIGRRYGDAAAGGQSLGQKNTVLAVWLSQAFLDPISCVAPTAYIVWQNLVNSYQIYRAGRKSE